MGVGPVFSAFVYASYAWNREQAKEAAKAAQSTSLNPLTVYATLVTVLLYVPFLLFFSALDPHSTLFEYAHALFEVSPLFFVVINFLGRHPDNVHVNQRTGSKVAQLAYGILAGVSFAVYMNSLSTAAVMYKFVPVGKDAITLSGWAASIPTAFEAVWADILNSPFGVGLLGDLFGLFSFFILFTLDEEGPAAALSSLLLSLLVSPGFVFAMGFSRRETKLEKSDNVKVHKQ